MTHPMKIGCVTLVFYGTVVSACLFSRSRMRRIRCLRIRSIGMKKPRTVQPKEPVSDCSWCCFLRKIRFLASSPRLYRRGEEAKWFVRLWICIFFRRF